MAESPKFPRYIRNRVEEHDGDVGFLIGSRNMAVLHMRNEKYGSVRLFNFNVGMRSKDDNRHEKYAI